MTATVVRPLMRGWLHRGAFVVAVPALVILAFSVHGAEARAAGIVYGLGVCALYGVSGSYHRPRWSAVARERLKRADHGTIFVMIAATYTPLCLFAVRGALGTSLLVGVWVAAVAGFLLAVFGIAQRRLVGFALYLALGWLACIVFPAVLHRGAGPALLMAAGGLVYTLGAVTLASRWPDPFPKVFGYHEVWHLMVIAASTCHWFLIYGILHGA